MEKGCVVLENFHYAKLALARFSTLANTLVKDVAKFKHIWCKKAAETQEAVSRELR